MKKVLVCLTFLLFVFGTIHTPYMHAGSIQDSIDSAKQDNVEISAGKNGDSDDSSSGWFIELIDFLFQLWLIDVVPVVYGGYPYAANDFLYFKPMMDDHGNLAWTPGRSWWAAVGGSGGIVWDGLRTIQPCAELTFDAQILKCFGPSLDMLVINDDGDPFMLFKADYRSTIIQTPNFLWDWYLGYGNKTEYNITQNRGWLTDHGFSFGTGIKLFPIRPVTLGARLGGISFEDYNMSDFDFEIGWMLDNREIYAKFRQLNTGTYDTPSYHETNMVTLGIRCWL